jgi:hypothetical protein
MGLLDAHRRFASDFGSNSPGPFALMFGLVRSQVYSFDEPSP